MVFGFFFPSAKKKKAKKGEKHPEGGDNKAQTEFSSCWGGLTGTLQFGRFRVTFISRSSIIGVVHIIYRRGTKY